MRILLIFLRHYVFCLIGGYTRYLLENRMLSVKNKPRVSYRVIKDYYKNPSNEFLDTYIGAGVLLFFVYLVIELTIWI